MKCIRQLSFLLITLAFPYSLYAIINPMDQSFAKTDSDLINSDFDLTRNYHSKRESKGLFGNNWCSDLEHKLRSENGQYYFSYCGYGRDIELSTNRGNYRESITVKRNKFEVNIDDSTYVFDKELKLIQIKSEDSTLRFVYNKKNQLVRITLGRTNFTVKYNERGFISRINKTNYLYDNNNLIKVLSNSQLIYTYKYKNNKLIGRKGPNKSDQFTVTYRNGAVILFKTPSCSERLKKNFNAKNKSVLVTRSCKNKKTITKKFKLTNDADYRNFSIKEQVGGEQYNRRWKNGRISYVETNKSKVKFEYDKYGSVKSMTANNLKFVKKMSNNHGVTRLNVYDIKNKKLGDIHVRWRKGEISGYSLMGEPSELKQSQRKIKLKTKKLKADITKVRATASVSGTYAAKRFKPFNFNKKRLRPEQIQIKNLILSELKFYDFLEKVK